MVPTLEKLPTMNLPLGMIMLPVLMRMRPLLVLLLDWTLRLGPVLRMRHPNQQGTATPPVGLEIPSAESQKSLIINTLLKNSSVSTGNPIPDNKIVPATTIKDFSSLNRIDLEEASAHLALLSPKQREYLRRIQRKVELYPLRFQAEQYLPHSTLLALSDWRSMQRYSMCCVPNRVNLQGRCKYRQFCRYCCFIRRQELLRTYLPSYDSGLWHFLTLSFEGGLGFEGASAYDSNDYWAACNSAVRTLVQRRRARGAVWVEEIAVLSYLPLLLVRPHVHAVVEADFLGEEDQDFLSQQLQQYRTSNGEALGLSPTVEVKPISSPKALYKSLSYLIKPIDIVRPYRSAWITAEANDRKLAWQLNAHASEFLAGYFQISNADRQFQQKIHYVGNLQGNHENYLGIRSAQREEYREFVDAIGREEEDDWDGDTTQSETQAGHHIQI